MSMWIKEINIGLIKIALPETMKCINEGNKLICYVPPKLNIPPVKFEKIERSERIPPP